MLIRGPNGELKKHPSSEPLREFMKSLAISYKAIFKFLVADCLKAFDLRPRMPKLVKAVRQLDTGNKGPGHTPFFDRGDGRFQCSACFHTSDREMVGVFKPFLVASHLVWSVGVFIFCILCGAHSRVNVRKLGRKCVRRTSSTAMRTALERLRHGLHPTRPLCVGIPAPSLFRSLTLQGFGDEETDDA